MKTVLYDEHRRLNARFTNFAGWEMPVSYAGTIAEHHCVRNAVGIFDLSHMGEVMVTGKMAMDFISWITTNDPNRLQPGMAQYSLMTNERGGVIDDLIVYRLGEAFLLVINAASRQKVLEWMGEHSWSDVQIVDWTAQTALIAVQGPRSQSVVQDVLGVSMDDLASFHFLEMEYQGEGIIVSRTGYTGEDGFELYLPTDLAVPLWRAFLEVGEPYGLQPIGLGARDTLRLESRLPLYGNDLDEETTPLEAGLSRFVVLEKPEFIGRDALIKQKESGIGRKLVGFVMKEKAIPRPGYEITIDGQKVGRVTSGTISPSLNQGIGLGYVLTPKAKVGATIEVNIRGKRAKAEIIKGRFFTKNK